MHTVLLLDISSGSVSAGIAGLEPGSLPKLLFSKKKNFMKTESSTLEQAMLTSLTNVLSETFTYGLRELKDAPYPNQFDHVAVALSYPWADSSITDDYEEGKNIFESVPVGDRFITSSAPRDVVRKIENEIIRTFGTKRGASIQSFQYIFHKVFSHFSEGKQSILVRFAGESTDSMVVKGDEIVKISHLDIGPNTVVRLLGEKLDLPESLARSKLSLFSRGLLDRDTAIRLDEILTKVEDEWVTGWRSIEHSAKQAYILSSQENSRLAETLLSDAVKGVDITNLNESSVFLPQISRGNHKNPELLIIASFSNMLV